MSSEKTVPFRNSLTLRLTLWYAGIFTASSFIAFFFFYALITAFIQEKTDQELSHQSGQFSLLFQERGMRAIEDMAVFEAQAAGERKVFFRLLYLNGQVFSSSNMTSWEDVSVSKEAIQKLVGGETIAFETVLQTQSAHQIRVLYRMIGPGVILQIGQSLENYKRILDAFQRIFLFTMAVLMSLAAGVGWFMANRAVSGVRAIARTAQGISSETLGERIPVKGRGDEIDQLAMTLNQMLDRIQSLVGEIRQMSDDIAHDLKSPLTRIRGMAEIALSTGSKTSAEYEAMAASVIEECDRLQDIINTMLMISKTEAGLEKPSHETFDLAALVREACELFEITAEDRNLTLTCSLPDACTFCGDARMLQRMLANLLDNAIKYTPPGGKIETSLAVRLNGEAIFEIRDTGIGISPEALPHIFERFYRGDQSRSESGTGLGLSLARAIARAHGGDITVESTPGEGSAFTARLISRCENS